MYTHLLLLFEFKKYGLRVIAILIKNVLVYFKKKSTWRYTYSNHYITTIVVILIHDWFRQKLKCRLNIDYNII